MQTHQDSKDQAAGGTSVTQPHSVPGSYPRWVQAVCCEGTATNAIKIKQMLMLRGRCWILAPVLPTLTNPGESLLVFCLPELLSVADLNELGVVCSFMEHTCDLLFSLYLRIKSDIWSVPNSELLAFLTWEKTSACMISWTLWWDWWNAMLMAPKLSWHLNNWIDPTSPPSNSAWALSPNEQETWVTLIWLGVSC